MEYKEMSKFYDLFYKNKNYKSEIDFLISIFPSHTKKILDIGCGTGEHSKFLIKAGYEVHGFDLSEEIVKIARQKCNDNFYQDNLLTFKSKIKYDAVISMFAVFNHLKSYKEFEIALKNISEVINENAVIIIDLHNPQKSGTKTEQFNEYTRTMKWKVCRLLHREYSIINYVINEKNYKTHHIFKIFKLNKLKKLINKCGFSKVTFYENYKKNFASDKSKNIQIIIEK